jgi:endonuclease-3
MKSAHQALVIFDALDEQHPGADTELHFSNAFELLTATILSAQSTDQRVNMVTPALFRRYSTPSALAQATPEELEPQIHSTGFFRAKSKALIGMAQAIVSKHHGQVPTEMDQLTALPGVGRKTANVVLGHALGVPGFPVDRHVLRVANRIGIAEGDDAERVEQQLCAVLPRDRWTRGSDALILHGRRICRPQPKCDHCLVREHCDYVKAVDAGLDSSEPQRPKAGRARRAAAPIRTASSRTTRATKPPKPTPRPRAHPRRKQG